ncbi:ATP-grasp domain-containing protein [Pyxidicoccus fallax]|uniref:ATP-grasp domain-containing protein n=1 Tax=Pyxidicoccus fallax TaxID=394095 RepID=A0A848L7W8_9BACT|nr:ATP-grasp domain-containing protein [Pyxidicoccus fallax]NMO14352.1 ATP-grasp domain-containing protein [Pyxidicoccus fallax]NPC77141.1 ATP-grasp domain-containing protein [Pyxidicoccus fallax]
MSSSRNPKRAHAILFGRNPHQYDTFDVEAEAAEALGVDTYQADLSALLSGNASQALAAVPACGSLRLLYRGWMLTGEEYAALDEAVSELGHQLMTTPEQYAAAHYLPNWYPRLAPYTARSVWTEGTDATEAWNAAKALGSPPWLVKDHVKSAKERWAEACFVPAGATREDFERICANLVEERGDRFERGLVVRRYLPLKTFGRTPAGPAHLEFRLFFGRGRLLAAEPYHDFDVEVPDFSAFEPLARRIDSPFFTLDVAMLEDGGWAVVEVNDGGVSGLPPSLDPRELFAALLRIDPA